MSPIFNQATKSLCILFYTMELARGVKLATPISARTSVSMGFPAGEVD